MITLLRRAVVSLFVFSLAGSLAIILDGLHDNLHPADVAVVLGAMVTPDGRPSQGLKARLDHTVELYRQGYCEYILVSGGLGREGYDEPVAMRHYLEAKGIPGSIIFEDNGGTNTWHTAQDTALFLEAHHLKSVLIVSEYFHVPRCRLAFAKFGIAPVYWSHAHLWARRNLFSVPREVVGYIGYALCEPSQPQASAAL